MFYKLKKREDYGNCNLNRAGTALPPISTQMNGTLK